MDSAQPWTNRLRQRGNSGKSAETSTTVQQGSITRRKNVTRKNEAVKGAGKEPQSARPSGNPTKASSRKRKASNPDNDSVHRDSERESKRTYSQGPLPTTPTLETRRTERLRTAQTQRDKRNLTISPSTAVRTETLLPTPSLTDARRMTGSIADLPNSVSPIEVESLTSQSLVTIDGTASSLLSPPISNQGNSQLPEILIISAGENSRIERPFHSAPASTSSFEESSRHHTAEQSQAPPTLEPPFEYFPTRTSTHSQLPETEELSPVGRKLEYLKPENVAEAPEMERLLTLAEFAKDPLDLHEIVSGLFLGSFSVFKPSNIEKFRSLDIRRIFTIRPRLELSEDWDQEADEMIDNDAYFIRRRVEIVDHPSVDLLPHFQDIVQELDTIIESGEQVYVHCHMGRSRSAAVVVAYLMKKKQIGFVEACDLVRDKGREININLGFRQQLLIWDLIKDDWDNRETYAEYRYWRMANDAGIISHYYSYRTRSINLASGEPNRRTMMEFTETFPIPQDETNPVTAIRQFPDLQKPDHSWYRCCRCKYPLAPGNATFGLSNSHGERPECTHRFLCNPLSWMVGQIDADSPGGKLFCPNCSDNPEHVGEYCWFGLQCSCEEVVCPGLALLSKLENGHLRGVEFRRVREGSVDNDEVESSQETESQEANEDVDDVDEDDFDGLSESHESREEDADDEEIVGHFEEMLSESEEADGGVERTTLESDVIPGSQDVDWLTFPAEIHRPGGTQNIEIAKPDLRMIPRSVPMMDHRPPSMRNPHHLPIMPSRLRNTWKPQSRSSSSGNSQASDSSNVNENDNVIMDEPEEIDWGSSEPHEIDYQTFMEHANNQHP